MRDYWIVKRYHSGGSSVISRHEYRPDARAKADALNEQYQTDEYQVEKWLS